MSDYHEEYIKMLKHIAEIYGQLRKLEDDLLKFVFEHDPEKHPEDQYHKIPDVKFSHLGFVLYFARCILSYTLRAKRK